MLGPPRGGPRTLHRDRGPRRRKAVRRVASRRPVTLPRSSSQVASWRRGGGLRPPRAVTSRRGGEPRGHRRCPDPVAIFAHRSSRGRIDTGRRDAGRQRLGWPPVPVPARPPLSERPWLILLALVVLALNLRATAVSVGPLLTTLQDALGLDGSQAGLLTALPGLCFAVFGLVAPWLAARLGLHRTVVGALVAVGAGQLVRVTVDTPTPFLAASALSLAGMAVSNVLLPSLVKWHFPRRIGVVTAVYATALVTGLTLASIASVPAAQLLGGWRPGLAVWSLLAVLALPPWLALLGHDRRGPSEPVLVDVRAAPVGLAQVARTRKGWLMGTFFGVQSMLSYSLFGWLAAIYTGAGFSEVTSGLLLGICTGVAIPFSFLLPAWTARHPSPYSAMLLVVGCAVAGLVGLLVAPATVPWLWAVLLAVGTSAFPIFLALVGLRTETPAGTASLSAFSQGVGYLISATGPLAIGFLHEHSAGWTLPVLAMLAMVVPLTVLGLLVCRPGTLEAELRARD
nr:MFS transporter [Auraticoccus cholistanensis]